MFLFSIWSRFRDFEKTRSTFGMSEEAAENTKEMAFNQGFYNLFWLLSSSLGVGLYLAGAQELAWRSCSLVLAPCLPLLLFITSPDKRSVAIKQGTLPLIAYCPDQAMALYCNLSNSKKCHS